MADLSLGIHAPDAATWRVRPQMAAAAPDDSDWKQECTCVVLVGAGLLMVRLVLERVALPPLRRWSKARLAGVSGADPSTAAFKMFDDLYHTCVSTCFAVWCWTMLLTTETECTPWDTAHCLRGWPNHPKSTALLVYYAAYASVYVSELLGTLVGAGCMLTKNMVAHHMISLLLMSIGHWSGWHRIGFLVLCIYELSNPLLHAAKIFNHPALGHLAPVRNALFKAFAVVFFLARIVLATYCLSYQGWTCMWVPSYVYWRNNVMFSILQCLQFFWFYKIVQIAVSGKASRRGLVDEVAVGAGNQTSAMRAKAA